MTISLNTEQSRALASFFFDVAKGIVLGGLGFATLAPLETKLITVSIRMPMAFWCMRLALSLLENIP